ncbi:hypothetical protein BGZ63DRAFT_387530 [Mariannaea sp. PMI_226]|nr:hypothetical protein BGZ63DRAFT_387530 [Mariannaea sp. PMI_226]
MPQSQANERGSTDPAEVPYGHWNSFPWVDFPEWKGGKSVMFRSADGKRVAGAFRESATATLTYPCDEFTYVVKGWVKAHVHGGDTFTLKPGDCVYFSKGQTVDFSSSDDYVNVSFFFDDEKVTLI